MYNIISIFIKYCPINEKRKIMIMLNHQLLKSNSTILVKKFHISLKRYRKSAQFCIQINAD